MIKTSAINTLISLLSVIALTFLNVGCNKDEVIYFNGERPAILWDNEDGVYETKPELETVISPGYINVDAETSFKWTIEGNVISIQPELVYVFPEVGTYYISLEVKNKNGSVTDEIRVDVLEKLPPVISVAVPPSGLTLKTGTSYLIAPEIRSDSPVSCEWSVNGIKVSVEKDFEFCENTIGKYDLSLKAVNEDGENMVYFTVNVVNALPVELVFPSPCIQVSEDVRYVGVGESVYLRPYMIPEQTGGVWQWSVDGKRIDGADGRIYKFIPDKTGDFNISVKYVSKDGASGEASLTVRCVAKVAKREISSVSSAYSTSVIEYLPAPGQFINDPSQPGFGSVTTMEGAKMFACKRLVTNEFVSLGAWGGYIIVAFDHSISNSGDYDFAIGGNAIPTSNEPGIVWVMEDVNGNGMPDEEWKMLRGSEYGKEESEEFYAVTYYRPGAKMNTLWTDIHGGRGTVSYIMGQHDQDYYYPLWVTEQSYMLYGYRLASRTKRNPDTGDYDNPPFEWGYADNIEPGKKGTDLVKFRISDAVNIDGTPANLSHIDFIKVQTGINGTAGWLGEISTEVSCFKDLSVPEK